MQKILIATHNPAKLHELSDFLSGLPVKFVSLSDVGITEDIDEDGKTYQENSQKKALFYAKKSGLPAVSDDGGIEIVALNNEPGIHSKRWLGDHATEGDLLRHMRKVAVELPDENRDAYFRTVVSFALPNGRVWSVPGEIHGIITRKQSVRKVKGYPYRSFFFIPELRKYYFENELTEKEMLQWNHRRKAIEKLRPILIEQLSLANL